MCQPSQNKQPKCVSRKSRLKLWEMPQQCHCPVVGTCMTMAELRKIQRVCGLVVDSRDQEYQLHSTVVGSTQKSGVVARRVQKMLDRKYNRWVKEYGCLSSAVEQRQFWSDAIHRGDISGPLWALLSHASTCRELADRALGEVHMLSHLQGAAHRADLKRVDRLEKRVIELEQQLELQRNQSEHKLASRQQLLEAQQCALAEMKQRLPKVSHSESQLRDQLTESRQQKRLLQRKLNWAVTQLAEREQRLTELEHGHNGLIEQLQETQQEHQSMEQAMQQLLQRLSPLVGDTGENSELSLDGKRLAYIGGRPALYPHLKRYVETLNGKLSFHDGGQEESRAALCKNLNAADLVFCPVDCISHDACLRVKKFCKQHQKPFVALRSASLSAFSNGLQALTAESVGQGESWLPVVLE